MDRLAALRARVKAKEAKAKEELQGRLDTIRKEWDDQEAREKEERKELVKEAAAKKRKAEAALAEATAAKKVASVKELPKCQCGIVVVLKTVSKEGPHKGRDFIACTNGKKDTGGCNYFAWAAKGEYSLPEDAVATQPKELPTCQCGNRVLLKRVDREGPNKGREYISCQQGKKDFGGCGYFQWVTKGEYAVPDTAVSAGPKELPKCQCGNVVVFKTVTKEGPNKGRDFIACLKGKKDFGGCDFFAWAAKGEYVVPDDAASAGPKELPKCQCGNVVVLKTVTKEGPNKGRDFIACLAGKKDFGGCGYFEWAAKGEYAVPDAETQGQDSVREHSSTSVITSSLAAGSSSACHCNVPAVIRTVNKTGAHFGRTFLHCSKGKKDQGGCGFFVWRLDEAVVQASLSQAGA